MSARKPKKRTKKAPVLKLYRPPVPERAPVDPLPDPVQPHSVLKFQERMAELRDAEEDRWADAASRWFWHGLEPLELRSARRLRELSE